jgi:hypothetical protein
MLALSSTIGCISPPTPAMRASDAGQVAPPSVVEVRPRYGVAADAPVAVALSEPVMLAGNEYPVSLKRTTGAQVDAKIDLSAAGDEIDLVPILGWPVDEVIEIDIGPGFVSDSGAPLVVSPMALEFDTVSSTTAPAMTAAPPMATTASMIVRSPVPGQQAPYNLAYVSVVVSPASAAQGLQHVDLASEHGRTTAYVVGAGDGVLLAMLPMSSGPCEPLCPNGLYHVTTEGDAIQAIDGPRGEVATSSIADLVPPVLTSSTVLIEGDQLAFDLTFSEPVLLRGMFRTANGTPMPLVLPVVASDEIHIEPGARLMPSSRYTFSIDGVDLANNALSSIEIDAQTPPRIEAQIDQIVPTPLHDWNHSDGSGVPFGPYPGTGTVSSADEWVQLVNLSAQAIDLTTAGLVLRVVDSSTTETALGSISAIYFGDGGSVTSWWPGEAVVFHPKGTMSKRGFAIELILGSRLLDRVSVGDVDNAVSSSTTPPDDAHEALTKTASGDWRWCVPQPGDPVPGNDCS